jgi:FlaA1/EpsC-like NDP-sugar epimerase
MFLQVVNSVLNSERYVKRIITATVDSIFIIMSFWAAFVIRLDNLTAFSSVNYWLTLIGLVPISLLVFIKLGLYRSVLRYISSKAVWLIVAGAMLSTAILIFIVFFSSTTVPRSMPLIYFVLILLTVGGARLFIRELVLQLTSSSRQPVIIYGAGSAGRQLATAITTGSEYYVSAFIDDDVTKSGSIIQGIPVTALIGLQKLIDTGKAVKVLLALPSASRTDRNRVINALGKYPIQVKTIPNIKDVIEGNFNASEFIDIEIEDLLGRESVTPLPQLLAQNITGKNVMITGAGGSIGTELCRQIIKFKPIELILFESSEFALYQIEKELSEYIHENELIVKLHPLIGSVKSISCVENVMMAFNINTIYHTAAYKHVPLVEHNVVEGIRNNVFGTYFTAKAAINSGVETFVLVSTDKAVRPTNVMGASKRMAELVLQALSEVSFNKTTRFCIVRFGNVLGSSGSVIPLFRRQIQEGGPITLTHKDITRYFMTIPEAAQLVVQAGAMGKGGDVFILDMGESVKIINLAEKLVRLSGLKIKDESNPNGDIEIEYTGLRPGEKLFEELLIGNNVQKTFHKRIMTANETKLSWDDLEPLLNDLDNMCHNFDHEGIRQILLNAPIGFNPTDGICDLVWIARNKDTSKNPISKVIQFAHRTS